ncbi:hypothetical protein ACFVVU_30570 [Kitasatospora sp. NPDC057965]|uniref:hypothetical protein n=1 Tax=Kitasatospora sp. NPDC057965 TaxID=3346291 RepID=UPI0036DAD1F6
MPKSQLNSGDSVFRRRLLIGLGVLLATALLAGLAARLAGGGRDERPAATPTASASARPGSSATAPAATPTNTATEAGPGVARPPRTSTPTEFASAFAQTLWSYDTRALDQQAFVNGLRLWLTPETQYADGASVEAQVPDPVLWSRMRDNAQTATAAIDEAHLPGAFQQAVAKDPGALTAAYIYAVTVTGKVEVAWTGAGRGAETRAITLAVQCRPQQPCALAAIAPTVYP